MASIRDNAAEKPPHLQKPTQSFFESHYTEFPDEYSEGDRPLQLDDHGTSWNLICSALSDLTEPATILDVGCGSGGLISHVANLHPQHRLLGFEPYRGNSSSHLKIIPEIYADQKQLFDNHPLGFDVLIFHQSLMFMNPLETTLLPYIARMNPGSKFLILNPHPGGRSQADQAISQELNQLLKLYPAEGTLALRANYESSFAEAAFEPESIKSLLISLGFKKERLIQCTERQTLPLNKSHKRYCYLYDTLFLSPEGRAVLTRNLTEEFSKLIDPAANVCFYSTVYFAEFIKQ